MFRDRHLHSSVGLLTVATPVPQTLVELPLKGLGAVGANGSPPILLGSGNGGRLTLGSHCPVPSSTPIAGLYFLHMLFLVFIKCHRVHPMEVRILCPFLLDLYRLSFNFTQTLGPSAVTGLSRRTTNGT